MLEKVHISEILISGPTVLLLWLCEITKISFNQCNWKQEKAIFQTYNLEVWRRLTPMLPRAEPHCFCAVFDLQIQMGCSFFVWFLFGRIGIHNWLSSSHLKLPLGMSNYCASLLSSPCNEDRFCNVIATVALSIPQFKIISDCKQSKFSQPMNRNETAAEVAMKLIEQNLASSNSKSQNQAKGGF